MVEGRELSRLVLQQLLAELVEAVERRAEEVEALHGDGHEREERLAACGREQAEQLTHLLIRALVLVLGLARGLTEGRVQLQRGAQHLLLAQPAEHHLVGGVVGGVVLAIQD